MPSGALFTRISSRNRQIERRRRASVKNNLFEHIRDTRKDAEHVTLYEPAEREMTPSGALFTRISSRNRQFERRRRASVKNKLFEQIRDTRNDAKHVTLFLRNGEICGTNALRNERRRRTEHFHVDFGRVAKRACDAVLAKPTICGTSTDAE